MSNKKPVSKKRSLYVLAFTVIIGLLGVLVLFQGRAAEQDPPAPAVYLTPTDVTYSADQTFTVAIRANSGSVPMISTSADFTYPTELLEFQSIDTTNTAFKQIAASEGGAGRVYFAGSLRPNDPQSISGDHLLAVVTFRTKTASGTANLDFQGTKNIIYRYPDVVNLIDSPDKTYGASFTIDTSAPEVSISSPANGAQVTKGTSAPITVTATDTGTVSSVEILVDEVSVATLTDGVNGQYTYTWNTSNVSLGSHDVRAIANDSLGNQSSSETITVQVVDKSKPTVTMTEPANDDTVGGSTPLAATATDNPGGSGIAKVEFYVNNEMVHSDTTSPYEFDWDSTSVPDGVYAITARAHDKANPANIETSEAISITVQNNDNEKPSTPANFRSTGTGLDSVTLEWSASTDNVGVVGYRITRNGSIVTTTDRLTFTDTGLNDGTAYNYTIVALDDAGNSSSAEILTVATKELKYGDFDRDDEVTLQDLTLLILNWDGDDPKFDLDDSGVTDLADLSLFIINFPRENFNV